MKLSSTVFSFPTIIYLSLANVAYASSSAWNGHTTPGSQTPSQFTPLYVASGTRAVDSSSPLISYNGAWHALSSPDYYKNTAHQTSAKGASAIFHFSGTGIEWYGTTGDRFGSADVFVDGKLARRTTSRSQKERQQQLLFFSYNLTEGHHSIKILNIGSKSGSRLAVDAFVITNAARPVSPPTPPTPGILGLSSQLGVLKTVAPSPASGWTLSQKGSTGVAAMQLSIVSPSHAIIVDKVEHNPLTISGHPAWAALYNLETHDVKPLAMKSNSFCAGGTFLSNGTLINVGGNPVVSDHTSAADFSDVDGLQAIRLFHPCESKDASGCSMYENHARVRMASPRWYNTVLRISDGSAMIIGGSKRGGWINNATTNNPTIEFYPPKNVHGFNGLPIPLQFLVDTLNSNLFPIAFSLPGGKIFLAANNDATIYDWKSNTEQRLPKIPNGVRVTYPMTGTGLLLPLNPENNYTPEILLCGGSTNDDTKPGYEMSSQDPASAQCARMTLTDAGIQAGWEVEQMPQPRMMPDAVLLPTGQVVIVNGAASGISGYANVLNQVGTSNADNPVLMPLLYTPSAPAGSRFSQDGLPSSQIPRLYHSTATLTPRGDIMIAGSNPNLDRSEVRYGTEYRVEWLGPPYMAQPRSVLSNVPTHIEFGKSAKLTLKLSSSSSSPNVQVACMDLGYVTHAVHANTRLVYLTSSYDARTKALTVTGPPDGGVYPPGPAWLYVVVDGVPSVGERVMIGDGRGPVVDDGALANMLKTTKVDQYQTDESDDVEKGSE